MGPFTTHSQIMIQKIQILKTCSAAISALLHNRSQFSSYDNITVMNKLMKQDTQREHYNRLEYMYIHLCMQRVYCELSTGEFTGGGALLCGAAGRKPCVQLPPLLTRQCANFSSSSQCLVSMTTTTQRCLYMRVHIAEGGLCQRY